MSYKRIFSREFLEKTFDFSTRLKDAVFETVEQVLKLPGNTEYYRPYLAPFRQAHPSYDRQFTLFFEVNDVDKTVFFIWINDPSCLHNTRMSFGDDPCAKEFLRRKGERILENYLPTRHDPTLEVTPLEHFPTFVRYLYLGSEISTAIGLNDGVHVAYNLFMNEYIPEISEMMIVDFLDRLYEHVKSHNVLFEFRVYELYAELISDLNKCKKSTKWEVVKMDEFYCLKPI